MKNGRLVVVSNRLPRIKIEGKPEEAASSYGLHSTLVSVMAERGPGLWMGWSGATSDKKPGGLDVDEREAVKLLGLDLPEAEATAVYQGFCHRTLWPMCHLFNSKIRLDRGEQEAYFKVAERFAHALIDLLEPHDLVWVHDYPMVPVGRYLRDEGFHGPIAFSLHVPFPPLEAIEILTDPLGFMDSWLYYDLVSFHTDGYAENYFEVMGRLMLGVREGERLFAGNRKQRVLTCPIGIDAQAFDPAAAGPDKGGHLKGRCNLGEEGKLLIGVDRLDYTKGIPERLHAFEHLLRHYPAWRRKASLVQICSPSRTRVKEYKEQKTAVEAVVGRINGEYAEADWTPVQYLYRTYAQQELARFYREADVGLVTPLRDGMNLVAMEYVAAQDPANPGVLVLSRFTGVAEYLHEAVLVNPYLPDSVAEGIDRGLSMSLRERQDRHQAMLQYVTRNSVFRWANTILDNLAKAHNENLTGQ
jgi:trehalose 6-phosphate synthase